jgi:hypothetical protein
MSAIVIGFHHYSVSPDVLADQEGQRITQPRLCLVVIAFSRENDTNPSPTVREVESRLADCLNHPYGRGSVQYYSLFMRCGAAQGGMANFCEDETDFIGINFHPFNQRKRAFSVPLCARRFLPRAVRR